MNQELTASTFKNSELDDINTTTSSSEQGVTELLVEKARLFAVPRA